MARNLEIRILTPAQLRQAFPLIQAIIPGMTLEAWLSYADTALNGSDGGTGGIVAAHGTDSYIYGLFCYRVVPSLRHGRSLSVEHVVVLDPIDRPGVTKALLGAIDQIARQAGCAHVMVDVPHKAASKLSIEGGLGEPLLEAGHRIESLRLGKPIGKADGRRMQPGREETEDR